MPARRTFSGGSPGYVDDGIFFLLFRQWRNGPRPRARRFLFSSHTTSRCFSNSLSAGHCKKYESNLILWPLFKQTEKPSLQELEIMAGASRGTFKETRSSAYFFFFFRCCKIELIQFTLIYFSFSVYPSSCRLSCLLVRLYTLYVLSRSLSRSTLNFTLLRFVTWLPFHNFIDNMQIVAVLIYKTLLLSNVKRIYVQCFITITTKSKIMPVIIICKKYLLAHQFQFDFKLIHINKSNWMALLELH